MDYTYVALLKACAKEKDLSRGSKLHVDILKGGYLENNSYIASSLINMYAKCGSILKAHDVLKELSFPDPISWNALITGYAQGGNGEEALSCYDRMHNEASSPNVVTYASTLKACSNISAVEKGKQIHLSLWFADLLQKDVVLGIALVDMYVKCHLLLKAQQVHDDLPFRSAATWAILIAGYVQHGKDSEALQCYEQMQSEGFSAEVATFVCILKACGSTRDLEKGKKVHDEIVSREMLKDMILCNTLLDMYVKCGMLACAQEILYKLPIRNEVTWNALIAGCIQEGRVHLALDCLKCTRSEGIFPDIVTFICILKACSIGGALDEGKRVHQEIIWRDLLGSNIALGNALIDMYVECGTLTKAREVFDELSIRDILSWNTMIYGYCKDGKGHDALVCFDLIQSEGLFPDEVTFACVLKACGMVGATNKGKHFHYEVFIKGLLKKNSILGAALVDMYVKCGILDTAHQVFEELPFHNVVCWSSLISGYVEQGKDLEALDCFEQMKTEGLSPDAVTFMCILMACGRTRDLDKGKRIHKEIVKRDVLEKDSMLSNALMDMYVKCGEVEIAYEVLEELHVRNDVSWNTLISGYVEEGQNLEAINCFEQMQCEGLLPNVVTFIAILQACGSLSALDEGEHIHHKVMSCGLLGKEIMLGNALLDMYAKCGQLIKAQAVFEGLLERNTATWNAMFTACIQHEQGHEALNYFERMLSDGLSPDALTFICMLRACGCIGAVDKGKEIHNEIVCRNLIARDVVIGNALVDMYAKCGILVRATQVLEELPVRDIICWNTMISGYAKQGRGHEALRCFKQMQGEGVPPDKITLLCLLCACSHSGLFDDAQILCSVLKVEHNITLNMDHHTCMVVVFGYAGYFDKAISVMKNLPSNDHLAIWLALLGACAKWGNLELGRCAFDEIIQRYCSCTPAYVLVANVFVAAHMEEDAQRIEKMLLKYADT